MFRHHPCGGGDSFGPGLYGDEALRRLPAGAVDASMGCGRLGVTGVVADDHVSPDRRAAAEWSTCAAGSLSITEYQRALADAGFTDVEVRITHPVEDGFDSAVVHARRRPEVA